MISSQISYSQPFLHHGSHNFKAFEVCVGFRFKVIKLSLTRKAEHYRFRCGLQVYISNFKSKQRTSTCLQYTIICVVYSTCWYGTHVHTQNTHIYINRGLLATTALKIVPSIIHRMASHHSIAHSSDR